MPLCPCALVASLHSRRALVAPPLCPCTVHRLCIYAAAPLSQPSTVAHCSLTATAHRSFTAPATPNKGIKSSNSKGVSSNPKRVSPNRKRVSPPHCYIGLSLNALPLPLLTLDPSPRLQPYFKPTHLSPPICYLIHQPNPI
ncbi:hypothetical protein U1Q18_052535 [Sarracenia purpurea var. burkii]